MRDDKKFGRVIDLVSIATIILLIFQFMGLINREATIIPVLVFWHCLTDYARENDNKRRKKKPRTTRRGWLWVVVWWGFAAGLWLVDIFLDIKDHLHYPAEPVAYILAFVTLQLHNTRKMKKMEGEGDERHMVIHHHHHHHHHHDSSDLPIFLR